MGASELHSQLLSPPTRSRAAASFLPLGRAGGRSGVRKGEKKSRPESWGHLEFRGLKASPRGTPDSREPRAGCLNTPSLLPLLLSTTCAWAQDPGSS